MLWFAHFPKSQAALFGRVERIQKQEHQPIIRHGRKKIPKQNSTAPARLQPATLQVLSSQGPQPVCLECTWEEYAVKVIFPAPPLPLHCLHCFVSSVCSLSPKLPCPLLQRIGCCSVPDFPGARSIPANSPSPSNFQKSPGSSGFFVLPFTFRRSEQLTF